jgi:uncharacterized protein (PEP-CTERM system associated)
VRFVNTKSSGALVALAVYTLASRSVLGADWTITPRLNVRETYSDNIGLAQRGQEQSDFVTEVSPAVSISGRGARLQLNADYALQYRLYAKNSDSSGFSHALRSNALLDVWNRNLFLEGQAGISEQDISTLRPTGASNVNLSGNQTEVRTATISPYWISRLGTFANLQARYRWNRAETSGDTNVGDTESQAINLTLSSGVQFNDLGWSLAYSKQNIDSTEGEFEQRQLESVTASVSYRFLPTLSGLVTVGRDDNTYGSARGDTGGNFYSVGFEWVPSSRTSVRAEWGRKYFGDTANVNMSHRTRLTSWTLTYAEQVIADAGLFSLPTNLDTAANLDQLFLGSIPDPIERQQAVQAFIVANGLSASLPSSVDVVTNQVTLSKRLQGTFGLRGIRGNLLATVFRDDRSSESENETVSETDPFSITDNVVQTGYSAILSWRFSQRTSGSVSLGQNRIDYEETARRDVDTNFRVGVTHQLQPKLRGSLEYRFLNRNSSGGGDDVRENAVTGTLSLAF